MDNKEEIIKKLLDIWVKAGAGDFYIEKFVNIEKQNDDEFLVSTKEKSYETGFEITVFYEVLVNSCEVRIKEL